MSFVGIGVGLVYAMLAKLIVDAVRREVTGVAMGMNTVMRTIGGVIGGQVGAAILSAVTIAGTPDIPAENAFTITFLTPGVAAFIGALAHAAHPAPARATRFPCSGSSAGSRPRRSATEGRCARCSRRQRPGGGS